MKPLWKYSSNVPENVVKFAESEAGKYAVTITVKVDAESESHAVWTAVEQLKGADSYEIWMATDTKVKRIGSNSREGGPRGLPHESVFVVEAAIFGSRIMYIFVGAKNKDDALKRVIKWHGEEEGIHDTYAFEEWVKSLGLNMRDELEVALKDNNWPMKIGDLFIYTILDA